MTNSSNANPALEEWITQLLLQPKKELNRKYNRSHYEAARDEVKSLPGVGPMNYNSCAVSDSTLHQLHQRIRGQRCEAPLWDGLVFYLNAPLPSSIVHDLLDRFSTRTSLVVSLGHTRQRDDVQWRLASLVDEALLTLVRDLFTKPSYPATDLQKLLDLHPDHLWLLNSWEHGALYSPNPQDLEKEIIFQRWAWQHPDRTSIVPTPQCYLEIIAEKQERQQQEQRRLHQLAQEEQERQHQEQLRLQQLAREAEQRAEARRRDLQRIARTPLETEEIERILQTKDPDELLAFSQNHHVPIHYLETLINCYGIKGARQIREAVQSNLQSRKLS